MLSKDVSAKEEGSCENEFCHSVTLVRYFKNYMGSDGIEQAKDHTSSAGGTEKSQVSRMSCALSWGLDACTAAETAAMEQSGERQGHDGLNAGSERSGVTEARVWRWMERRVRRNGGRCSTSFFVAGVSTRLPAFRSRVDEEEVGGGRGRQSAGQFNMRSRQHRVLQR